MCSLQIIMFAYLRGLCLHTASYAPVDSQEFWSRHSDQVHFSGMRNVGQFIRKARQADGGRISNEFDSLIPLDKE